MWQKQWKSLQRPNPNWWKFMIFFLQKWIRYQLHRYTSLWKLGEIQFGGEWNCWQQFWRKNFFLLLYVVISSILKNLFAALFFNKTFFLPHPECISVFEYLKILSSRFITLMGIVSQHIFLISYYYDGLV